MTLVPAGSTWREFKSMNGDGITLDTLNSAVGGIKIHSTHDPVVPLGVGNYVYKKCRISYKCYDALENNAFANGFCEECLFSD